MAQINGQAGGFGALVPVATAVRPSKPKTRRKVKDVRCTACDGIIPKGKKSVVERGEEPVCKDCAMFFGTRTFGMNGCTNVSPEQARETITAILDSGWAMVLKSNHLAMGNGGTITLELSDIMKVQEASVHPVGDNELCSKALTWRLFTIKLMVGQTVVTQFPHEVSAINWLTIMELRSKGEIEEQYLGADDQVGYFGPTPAMREQIRAVFGDR